MKKALIIAAVLLLLGAGAYSLTRGDESSPATETTNNTLVEPAPSNNQTETPANGDTPVSSQDTITYNGSSFSPSSLNVKAGTAVIIVNNSSSQMEISSDPHPVHTANSELNTNVVGPGQSVTITPTQTGTWGFHDHLNSTVTGTLIVE